MEYYRFLIHTKIHSEEEVNRVISNLNYSNLFKARIQESSDHWYDQLIKNYKIVAELKFVHPITNDKEESEYDVDRDFIEMLIDKCLNFFSDGTTLEFLDCNFDVPGGKKKKVLAVSRKPHCTAGLLAYCKNPGMALSISESVLYKTKCFDVQFIKATKTFVKLDFCKKVIWEGVIEQKVNDEQLRFVKYNGYFIDECFVFPDRNNIIYENPAPTIEYDDE